jgi:hypothetical protein
MKDMEIDPEDLIPRTQSAFRVDQVAKHLNCSVTHIFNLITEGEIVVPKEQLDSAPSRASVLVPRASLVDFVRRRINSPERIAAKAALEKDKIGKRKGCRTQHKGGPR